jgi:ABC-type multidrug transport system ATPase subunit
MSTHVVAELHGLASYLLLLSNGRLMLHGEVDELLARHRRSPDGVVTASSALGFSGSAQAVSLEDLILSYLRAGRDSAGLA